MKSTLLPKNRPTPRLRNIRLRETIENLRLKEIQNIGPKAPTKKPRSNLICSNADLFVGAKKRGTIYFSIGPSSYSATLLPMVDFVRFDATSEKGLVRQIMEWVSQEYVGATNIEVMGEKKTSVCEHLNKKLVAFGNRNRRNKVVPAGRTLSRAYMPTPTRKEKSHARIVS